MPANINPIFASRGLLPWSDNVTVANINQDGSGALNFFKVAGAEWVTPADGVFVLGIRFKSKGANVASLARVFIARTGIGGSTTINDIFMLPELVLPATALSQTAPQGDLILPMGYILPAGHRIFWTLATAVATGWQAMAVVGDYTA